MEYKFIHPSSLLRIRSDGSILDTSASSQATFEFKHIPETAPISSADVSTHIDVDDMLKHMLHDDDDDDIAGKEYAMDFFSRTPGPDVSFVSDDTLDSPADAIRAFGFAKDSSLYCDEVLHVGPDAPSGTLVSAVSDASIRAIPLLRAFPCNVDELPILSYTGGDPENAWSVDTYGYACVPTLWYAHSRDLVIGSELYKKELEGVVSPYNLKSGAFMATECFTVEMGTVFPSITSLCTRFPNSIISLFFVTGPVNLCLYIYKAVGGRDTEQVAGSVCSTRFYITAVTTTHVRPGYVLRA